MNEVLRAEAYRVRGELDALLERISNAREDGTLNTFVGKMFTNTMLNERAALVVAYNDVLRAEQRDDRFELRDGVPHISRIMRQGDVRRLEAKLTKALEAAEFAVFWMNQTLGEETR